MNVANGTKNVSFWLMGKNIVPHFFTIIGRTSVALWPTWLESVTVVCKNDHYPPIYAGLSLFGTPSSFFKMEQD